MIIVGPVGSHNAHYKADAEADRHRGAALDAERRQAHDAQRDLVAGQGGGAGREHPRVPGPRQRLAEHLPAVPDRDQGRPRPRSVDGRRRRRRPSTTARTTSGATSGWRPTRSSCSTTCATPRGTRSPGWPWARSPTRASGWTTTARASSARARGRCSPRATRRTRSPATSGSCSRPTGRWTRSSGARPRGTATSRARTPSQRTPGLAYQLDPDTRGAVRLLPLADRRPVAHRLEGHRHPAGAHGHDPGGLRDPGRRPRSPPRRAIGLFATAAGRRGSRGNAGRPTLADGTRLRVTAEAEPAADGTRILAVTVMGTLRRRASSARTPLAPRDSANVDVWSLDQSAALLSPNDDGVSDGSSSRRGSPSRSPATLVDQERRPAAPSSPRPLTSDIAQVRVGPAAPSGAVAPDGDYTWTLKATDPWGNGTVTRTGAFTIDATRARLDRGPGRRPRAPPAGSSRPPTISALGQGRARPGSRSISWRLDGGAITAYAPPLVDRRQRHAHVRVPGDRQGGHPGGLEVADAEDRHQGPDDHPAARRAPRATPRDLARRRSRSRRPSATPPSGVEIGEGQRRRRRPPARSAASPIVVDRRRRRTRSRSRANDVAGQPRRGDRDVLDRHRRPRSSSCPSRPATPPHGHPERRRDRRAVALPFTVSEPGSVTATITDADGDGGPDDRRPGRRRRADPLAWDGRTAAGAPVPDGAYTVTLAPRDAAGNNGAPVDRRRSTSTARWQALTRTPTLFFPQDGGRPRAGTRRRRSRCSRRRRSSIRVLDARAPWSAPAMTDRALPAGAGVVGLERQDRRRRLGAARRVPDRRHGDQRHPVREPVRTSCAPTRSGSTASVADRASAASRSRSTATHRGAARRRRRGSSSGSRASRRGRSR